MSSIKPCVPCSVVSPKNVFIRENSERIIWSITDPICKGAEGRRVSITGLLMLWFFVRNLSLSSQAVMTVSPKELYHIMLAQRTMMTAKDVIWTCYLSRECTMSLRLNDLSSLLREYTVPHMSCVHMVTQEQNASKNTELMMYLNCICARGQE